MEQDSVLAALIAFPLASAFVAFFGWMVSLHVRLVRALEKLARTAEKITERATFWPAGGD